VRRALLAAALVCVGSAAHANPIDAFGFGARAPAMGGAQTAATRDGGANYYNPAAIAVGDDIRIDFGYQLATPRLRMNGLDQNVDESRGLAIGLTAPGEIYGLHVAFGAGVFLPDERVTRARTLASDKPRWVLYDNRPQRIFLGSNFAIRVGKRLYLGGGIAYMSKTEGTLDLTGRVGFPSEKDSDLALAIDTDVKTVRYPEFGVLFRATPFLDIGLSYRGEFFLKLDQKFSITGDVGPPNGPPVVMDGYFKLHSVALDLFQPEQWSTGFALGVTPTLLVAGDLTWQRWSRFDNPAAKIDIDLDLKDFNNLVNIPPQLPLPKAHFHDIVVPRLGVEWMAAKTRHTRWWLRGGYSFEPSPAPPQQGETNFVDNDKHTFSAGLGVEVARVTDILPRPFDIDIYAATTYLPSRAHRKVNVTDAVGDYTSDGYVLAAGLMTRWHF
jgi:long-chain fatty acid transport protein